DLAMQDMYYVQSKGPDLYRRSLYTFWKRTIAPPMMVNFDSSQRETCVVRETRTDTCSELYRLTGVDWSQVDGIDVQVAQTVIVEVGADLKAFPSEKHFANWLGLCPTNETSGGRVLKRRTPKVVNRAKAAFRQAASTLIRSDSYLGAQYRRLRTRM